jgi:hypothetical protein
LPACGGIIAQSLYYERLWEPFPTRQRAVLHALAERGPDELLSQAVREGHGLGPPSSVQRALQALTGKDVLDRYQGKYFFLDPLFRHWIRKVLA